VVLCPNGHSSPDHEIYCGQCGAPLAGQVQYPALPAGGSSIAGVYPPQPIGSWPRPQREPVWRRPTVFVPVLLVVAVLLSIAGTIAFVRFGQQNTSGPQSTSALPQDTLAPVAAPPLPPTPVPRAGNAPVPSPAEPGNGRYETIASYIKESGITETAVHMGDPGAPKIDLPVSNGWEPAGKNTPDWAYGAIIYTGPEAAEYTPSIVALVSKLTGNVDPQKIIDLAPGELNNLPGYKAMNEGATSTLGEYPAYQLGGTWESEGKTKIVAQKTVVIPGSDGLYVLQLNADGLKDQTDIVSAATDAIDTGTTITP
jgi:hypothetical protein